MPKCWYTLLSVPLIHQHCLTTVQTQLSVYLSTGYPLSMHIDSQYLPAVCLRHLLFAIWPPCSSSVHFVHVIQSWVDTLLFQGPTGRLATYLTSLLAPYLASLLKDWLHVSPASWNTKFMSHQPIGDDWNTGRLISCFTSLLEDWLYVSPGCWKTLSSHIVCNNKCVMMSRRC